MIITLEIGDRSAVVLSDRTQPPLKLVLLVLGAEIQKGSGLRQCVSPVLA